MLALALMAASLFGPVLTRRVSEAGQPAITTDLSLFALLRAAVPADDSTHPAAGHVATALVGVLGVGVPFTVGALLTAASLAALFAGRPRRRAAGADGLAHTAPTARAAAVLTRAANALSLYAAYDVLAVAILISAYEFELMMSAIVSVALDVPRDLVGTVVDASGEPGWAGWLMLPACLLFSASSLLAAGFECDTAQKYWKPAVPAAVRTSLEEAAARRSSGLELTEA